MKAIIEGKPKEIADLILALQGQRNEEVTAPLNYMFEAVRSAVAQAEARTTHERRA